MNNSNSKKKRLNMSWIYLILYSIITLILIKEIILINIKFLNEFRTKMNKISIIILILSIAGTPPLIGFIQKWIVLKITIIQRFFLITTLIVIVATLNFYIYIRIANTIIILKKENIKQHNKNNKSNWLVNISLPIFSCQIIK